ncbi:MAG: tetratricopeptide repeat protein [Pseudoflavonifractor sp.]|nr:tetratricopeptide repeat protein [Pseudoflavonifractor sp.]
MTKDSIKERRNIIARYIEQSRLRDALRELRIMVSGLHWSLQEDVNNIEDSYRMMLRYAADGVEDPGRGQVYDSIVGRMYGIIDRVSRERYKTDSPTLYFNTLRYEHLQPADTIPGLLARYSALQDKNSMLNLITSSPDADTSSARRDIEEAERRLFSRVWITYPLSHDDIAALDMAFTSDTLPDYFKELMVSALLLGLLPYYDESRLAMLLDVYSSRPDSPVGIKALCAALIVMYIHRSRIASGKLTSRVETIKDTVPTWHKDVRMVFMQFIRTRDTERINRKMRDEVIPTMMKLRPDIYKKFHGKTDGTLDLSDIEENPEWQEMLDKSGITDKMKELTKMQEDGGDVFMSTFAHLKQYPFFSDIANWFLPFRIDHTAVSDALDNGSVTGEIIAASPFLCNSDKYSIALSISSIPDQQRKFMMSQFNAQNLNAAEIRNSELLEGDTRRENIANKYVQDLYRFFKLFRRKNEFADPFDTPLNMLQVPVLLGDFNDSETLAIVAEFYFRRGHYEDAYDIFSRLSELVPPDAQLFQKMGYCLQQTGDIEGALKYYSQAELLNADSLWTLKRIASCYKLLGKPRHALSYYKRVAAIKPDDLSVAMSMGHCNMELGNHDEALKCYFKVEFLDEKSSRALRPIAWCSLLTGNLEQSRRYYDRILGDNPTAGDYLNMGHLELASGRVREALNLYKLSVANDPNGTESFIKSMHTDTPVLVKAGVSPSLIPLVIDSLLYQVG